VAIWRAKFKALKTESARPTFLKAVTHTKVHDLIALKQCLKRASPSVREAWEKYYPEWVDQVVKRIKDQRAVRTRRDPSSRASILASLTDAQRRTAETYRIPAAR